MQVYIYTLIIFESCKCIFSLSYFYQFLDVNFIDYLILRSVIFQIFNESDEIFKKKKLIFRLGFKSNWNMYWKLIYLKKFTRLKFKSAIDW